MSLRAKAIQGAFWSSVGDWSSQILSLVIFAILARILDAEAFGLIALVAVYIAFLQIFVDPGFSLALVQREQYEPGHLNAAFWISLFIAGTFSVASILSANVLADAFRQPQLSHIVTALSPLVVINALSVTQEAMLTRAFRFKALAVRRLMATCTGGVIGIGMALNGFGVWSLVGQQLTGSVVAMVALWVSSDWRPTTAFERRHFDDLAKFGRSILGVRFLDYVNQRFDQLLIGVFLDAKSLGYYHLARRIFTVLTHLLVNAPAMIALPMFSRLQGDSEQLRSAVVKATRFTSAVAIPAFTGLIIIAPNLIPAVFGKQWTDSVQILQLLSGVGVLYGLTYFVPPALIATNHPSVVFGMRLITSSSNVAAFGLALPWGVTGIATAFLARALLLTPLPAWAMRKYIGVSFLFVLRKCLPMFAAAIVMMIAAIMTAFATSGIDPWRRVVLMIMVSVPVYAAFLYIIDRKFVDEILALTKK